MSARQGSSRLDRHAEIGTLSIKVKRSSLRLLLPLSGAVVMEYLYLLYANLPGAGAFLLIGGSTCMAMGIWCTRAIGLPLLPLMAAQGLVIYGVPIVAAHENITGYPAAFVMSAGTEVLIFNLAMALSWWVAMQMMRPSPAVSYALHEFNKSGAPGLARLGFGMLVGATSFEVLLGLNLLDAFYTMLPSGADSILNALVSVASACGLFLVSMVIGGNEATPAQKLTFWALLVANTMIAADGFLLAAAAANLITVAIGLFWGGGRIPWTYLTLALLSLSFFNIGKTTMRNRYWGTEDKPAVAISIDRLPGVYAEWSAASYEAIVENNAAPTSGSDQKEAAGTKNQTLLDRVDNLQNILFVIDAIRTDHVPLLRGATYELIPPLLVPRVLWPSKPRSHEGQVMLNVHFGRQDLDSTFITYIAWGLLPEAYGNFGAVAGSLTLGVFLGVFFAWVENFTARKLVVSMEGFLSLCLLLSLMNSFEMVASVLVTSTFQSMVITVAASMPFVHRTVTRPRSAEDPLLE